jgi:hypothetical protein
VDWYGHWAGAPGAAGVVGATGVAKGAASAADPVADCSAGAPLGEVGALDHAEAGVEASEF